ncbi:hypothetical protein [Brevibacillus reuszeri]|uniref:hypothetical protein n=1 Tax=Brevibacillus reuszeri TaxID=54915 RepID=UPI003D1BF7A8
MNPWTRGNIIEELTGSYGLELSSAIEIADLTFNDYHKAILIGKRIQSGESYESIRDSLKNR